MTTVARSVPIARRQLQARRGRTLAGAAGIAVALLLILALKAIFAGVESRLTAYIDGTGADVIVAQQGVQTMHMTESALPVSEVVALARIPGVARVDGILYRSAIVEHGDATGSIALVGGGPIPRLVSGRAPRADEIVVDRALADRLAVRRDDSVRLLGARLRISGEIDGTAAITGSYAFTTRATMSRLLRSHDVLSYMLVTAAPGVSAKTLAARINRRRGQVTATPRVEFAASERRVVGDMSTDIVRAMIVVGFVIGVAVAGLVAYAQTLAQLRDYGLLRALGLRGRDALIVAVTQVAALVAAGFLAAVALVLALALLLPKLSPALAVSVRAADVAQAAAVAAAVTLAASLVPLLRVLRVDPASVFRRSS